MERNIIKKYKNENVKNTKKINEKANNKNQR